MVVGDGSLASKERSRTHVYSFDNVLDIILPRTSQRDEATYGYLPWWGIGRRMYDPAARAR